MLFRPTLKKAIVTNDLTMPPLLDVVANIIGVWLLIVSYLKDICRKHDGDSLLVSPPLSCVLPQYLTRLYCSYDVLKKGMDGHFYLEQMPRMKFFCFIYLLKFVSITIMFFFRVFHGYVVVADQFHNIS